MPASKLFELIETGLANLPMPETPSTLYGPVKYTLGLGGKRMRPQLVLLGAGLCGGDPKKALPAANAVELLHNFTLIHDDIMDAAESRRGKPAVHVKWDRNTAILSGDVMFVMAFEQLEAYATEHGYPAETLAALLKAFNKAAKTVCEGQAFDLEFEGDHNVSLNDYLDMISRKTGALLEASLVMGGISAGGDPRQISQLETIGKEAGLAFQIQDDLLDAVADPETFGKRRGGDIFEGKMTYLTILALERAAGKDKERILEVINDPECTESGVGYVIGRYHELGIISDTEEAIKYRYLSCLNAIRSFEKSTYQTTLVDLISSLMNRQI